jgi:hypothetical protein
VGHLARILIVVFAAPAVASTSFAQQENASQNPAGISMKSVEVLRQSGGGPKVIGGRPAKSSDWPASFYSSTEGSRCTATLVGPRALLLAAHCVGDGQEASIEFRGKHIRGTCRQADDYKRGDASADYALCRMSEAVSGILFESINIDPTRIRKGELLLLTGYGCTAPGGRADGVYRIAEAKIVALPGDREPNTILTQDKVAICPGDSGGGAYIVLSARKRLDVSVNSRVFYSTGESYLSSLSSMAGIAFLAKWSTYNGSEVICGYNLQDRPCR